MGKEREGGRVRERLRERKREGRKAGLEVGHVSGVMGKKGVRSEQTDRQTDSTLPLSERALPTATSCLRHMLLMLYHH